MAVLTAAHWEAVTPAMREVLRLLGGCPFAKRFYLARGTALALRLGHRLSVDLDFFSETDQVTWRTRQEIVRALTPLDVQVLEDYDGRLSNAGERLQIGMPGDIDNLGARQYIRIDRVAYSDGSHPEDCPGGVDLWPTEADGHGKSLSRRVPADYGNDVANWQAAAPSPGAANP